MQRYEHGGDIYSGNENIKYDYSINLNPLGMPKEVKEAVIKSIEVSDIYPDPHCRALMDKISENLGGFPKENLLVGSGASDLITRICTCFRPKLMLTLGPTFSEYERTAKLYGAEIKEHLLKEENNFSLGRDFLDDITEDVNLVFVCSPNNPTGEVTKKEFLIEVTKKCKEVGAILVIDECFLEFTYSGETMIPLVREFDNLIVLRAFTKLYSIAGLRLGYFAACEKLVNEVGKFGAEWAVSTPAQAAGIAALSIEPEWAEKTRAFVLSERNFVSEELSKLGFKVFPGEGNFILFKGESTVKDKLKERGILIRDASNFTGLSEEFFRIGVKDRETDIILLNTIKEIING